MSEKTYARADEKLFANIPQELRDTPQWECWRLIDGKKVPINPVTGKPYPKGIKADDMATATFAQAVNRFRKDQALFGIGFRLKASDPYTGIDTDDSRDPQTGKLDPNVEALIAKLGTYADVSPSGTGVKFILRGKAPQTLTKTKLNTGVSVEVYGHGRYFALTGCQPNGAGLRSVATAQAALDEFWQQVHFSIHVAENTTKSKKKKAGGSEEKIIHPNREPAIFAKGVELRKKTNLSAAQIEAALLVFNQERCDPPIEEAHIHDIAYRTGKYEEGQPAAGQPSVTATTAIYEGIIDPTALVAEVEDFIKGYVVLPTGLTLAVALWTIGTHIFSSFEIFPYLAITGPAKECGKTRLTEVLELICAKAKRTTNISEAALFRIIESLLPTLIIDEAEALADKRNERSQALVGILNGGHGVGATVIRCVGPTHAVMEFQTFCPKMVVAIGALRDTLASRSIMVRMQRKGREDNIGRFLRKRVGPLGETLRAKIAALAVKQRDAIEQAYAKLDFEELEDREAENWSPLLSLCQVLTPNRLLDLQVTAVRNGKEKNKEDAEESLSVRLMTDIRDVLDDLKLDEELFAQQENAGIATAELLSRLRAIEESPWGPSDLNLTARGLASRLHPFELWSRVVDTKAGTRLKGYRLSDLRPRLTLYARSMRTSVQDVETEGDKPEL